MRTPRVWGRRAARLAALQRGPRGEGTRTAMGASAYENGRRDRCRPHQLTLSFGIRYASSSPLWKKKVCCRSLVSPLHCSCCSGRSRPRSRSIRVGQDSHAPGDTGSSGRRRARPAPSDALPGCVNEPAQGVHAEGWAAWPAFSGAGGPRTVGLIRSTASPLARCPPQLPHASVHKSQVSHKKDLTDFLGLPLCAR